MPYVANAQMARLYTTEYGLPNSKVNNIYQDARGFVWVSTENGLGRFDGRDFLTFQYRADKTDGLASDLVLSVFEDSRGTLWTATSMGLQIFDNNSRSFLKMDLQDPESPGSTQHISCILEVKTGGGTTELWVATSQHGIYVIDPETKSLKTSRREQLSKNLPSQFVYTMFQDSRGWVWLAGETGGLSVVEAGSLQSRGITIEPNAQIRSLAEDPYSGNILIATMSGLYIYNASTRSMSISGDSNARTIQACSILFSKSMQKAGDRLFLIGAETEGLWVYDMNTGKMRRPNLPQASHDTSRWKVHCLMQDNQGNIWVGAFQTGVLVIPRSMYGFE